jgi:hypothetical protein
MQLMPLFDETKAFLKKVETVDNSEGLELYTAELQTDAAWLHQRLVDERLVFAEYQRQSEAEAGVQSAVVALLSLWATAHTPHRTRFQSAPPHPTRRRPVVGWRLHSAHAAPEEHKCRPHRPRARVRLQRTRGPSPRSCADRCVQALAGAAVELRTRLH